MTIGGIIFTAFLLALVGFYVYLIRVKFNNYKDESPEPESFSSPNMPGHKLWMLNLKTLEMNEISQDYINKNGHEKDCLYCSAINEKNAIKHFTNMVPGKFEKAK